MILGIDGEASNFKRLLKAIVIRLKQLSDEEKAKIKNRKLAKQSGFKISNPTMSG